ncbi:hypothetical protein Q3C01_29525 [Bradyrhizobium sp. UFLA05-109]
MSDWLHNLPIPWMALVIFGGVYLVALVIYIGVLAAATHKRIRSFKAISAGMLSPLGVVFGLFVVFTAAQVWRDNDRASTEVSREASALRSVLILGASFPGEPENKLRSLVSEYVQRAATVEWPMMAQGAETASLNVPSPALVQALQLVLSLTTAGSGQEIAQREIVSSLETALDARRHRILVSRDQVNIVKWSCLLLQAVIALVTIAFVHCDDPLAGLVSLALFATSIAASILLIAAYDRPFVGEISVSPQPLLHVLSVSPSSG